MPSDLFHISGSILTLKFFIYQNQHLSVTQSQTKCPNNSKKYILIYKALQHTKSCKNTKANLLIQETMTTYNLPSFTSSKSSSISPSDSSYTSLPWKTNQIIKTIHKAHTVTKTTDQQINQMIVQTTQVFTVYCLKARSKFAMFTCLLIHLSWINTGFPTTEIT